MTDTLQNNFYSNALQNCLSQQHSLMQMHQLSNHEKVWIRRAGSRNSIWGYRLLNLISHLTGIHLLTPVPNLGGLTAIEVEVRRLQALAEADICVPRILAHQADAIMISNIGNRTLEKEWRKRKRYPKILLNRWQLGLEAIADVHRKQQYLSETFARNMIYINEQQIGFIDFEDDPASVLTLEQCQARDWLCYLHSGAVMMINYHVGKEAQQLWHNMLKTQPEFIYNAVQQSLRKISWMRYFKASIWGKDTLKLAAMAQFI